MNENIPKATLERLIQLEELLKAWQEERITSVRICELTGWKDSLVRHDLWLINSDRLKSTEKVRGWKNGYSKTELLNTVRCTLKNEVQNDSINVCIVGLGRLGAALLDNSLVESSKYVIKAGFDSNLNRVEVLRSAFQLYPASEMIRVIKQENITLAILAVAEKDAQIMCDKLVSAGIKGIVNMTRAVIKVNESIKVENLSILNALKLVN